MKLNLMVGGSVFSAVLYENRSAEDFASLLPITLTLGDYHRGGGSSRLPKRLPADETAEGITISAGDICYYTPFRNVCVYYRNAGISFCQVTLGRIEERGIEAIRRLSGTGPVEVTFEVA